MKVVLPVGRDTTGRAGDRLVERMVVRGCQRRPSKEFVGAVVPEPVLTRLETADDGVLGGSSVAGCMLAGGVVAAANVAALGTPAEMEPPATRLQAFDATGTAGCGVGIDLDARICHAVTSSLLRGRCSIIA